MGLTTGDRVRVLHGYKFGMDGRPGLSQMERMHGKTLTIESKITKINNMDWFRVRENEWNWSEKMLEPVFLKKETPDLPVL